MTGDQDQREPWLIDLAEAILDVGGDFADDFVTGRRLLTSENADQVAAEIEAYWREP
jgi:hypothetical protein